jgi:hypothetical protein
MKCRFATAVGGARQFGEALQITDFTRAKCAKVALDIARFGVNYRLGGGARY